MSPNYGSGGGATGAVYQEQLRLREAYDEALWPSSCFFPSSMARFQQVIPRIAVLLGEAWDNAIASDCGPR